MAAVSTGAIGSVRRRLNELESALGTPPRVPSPSSRPVDDERRFDHGQHQAYKSTQGRTDAVGALSTSRTITLDNRSSEAPTTPTTPTSASSRLPSLSTSSNTLSSSTRSSPRPADLVLTPVSQAVSTPDRYSIASSSTTDDDTFSTVQLKTPTSGNSPGMSYSGSQEQMASLDQSLSFFKAENGVMSTLNDDEVDLGSTSTYAYGKDPRRSSALQIRTDLDARGEDALRTPIAGSSKGDSPAAGPGQYAGANSTKPLVEGVDFLLARIEKEKENIATSRRSLEGRERLKEDFQKLQHSPANATFTQRIGADASQGNNYDEKTDWGKLYSFATCAAVKELTHFLDFWGDVIASMLDQCAA